MQNKVLEQLKKKYEYLDFNNAKVLECFHNAIEDLKNDNPSAFENENMISLELEHYFLYYLVLESQNGNQEIYDAVSIAMESTNDFFVRRRKDLSNKFNKEKQKELYEKAFEITINCYYKRMRFASLLIQSLTDVYKDAMNHEKEQIKEVEHKEVENMAYNLNSKSLYEVFKDYNGKLSSVIFKAFSKKEEHSYALLVKKYGINLDGEKSAGILSYSEVTRIQSIISRLHIWFQYGEYLLNKEESLDSIFNFFVKTSDEKLSHIFADFQREKEAERNRAFSTKYEILTKYNISEKTLENAVCYIKNKEQRLLYKSAYGIGLKKQTMNEIRNTFNMKLDEYERTILMVQRQLPNLIKQAKEQEALLGDLNPQGVGKESPTPTKQNVTKVEESHKSEEIVSSSKENPILQEIKPKTKKTSIKSRRGKKYTYFCDKFYTDNMSEEERHVIDEKVYAAFESIHLYEDGKATAKKVYGEDLKQKAKDITLNRLENASMGNLVAKIKKIIFSEEKSKENGTNKRKRKQYFIEYLYKPDMTDLDKKELQEKFSNMVITLKERSPKAYLVVKKLYGENLNEQLSDYILTGQENGLFSNFVSSAKTLLNSKPKKEKKSTYKRVELKANFYEYFYTENMSLEEKQNINEKLTKALLFNKDTKAYQILYEVYNEELNLKEGIEVSRISKVTISNFVNTLSRDLTLDLDDLMGKSKRVMEPDTFFEYFYDPKMSLEEQEQTKVEILNVVNVLKKLYPAGYEVVTLLYDNDLSGKRKNITLSSKQKSNFNSFRKYIRNYYGKDNSLKNGQYISYHRRPLKFLMYFHKYGMNELEIKQQDEKVKAILLKQGNCDVKGYEVAKKLYGESLDSNLNPINTDSNENYAFASFVKRIKKILDNKVKNEFIVQSTKKHVGKKNRPSTFFEYFYCEGMTKEEKEAIDSKVLAFITKSKLAGVELVQKLYGENLDQLVENIELTKKDLSNIVWLRRQITKELIEMPKGENKKHPSTFFEYFYCEGMTEEEKEAIRNKVLSFVANSKLIGVEIAQKLYGKNLDQFDEKIDLTKKEKGNLNWLKHEITRNLKGSKVSKKNRPSTFFEYFYCEGMAEEEKNKLRKQVLELLKQKEGTQGYIGAQNIYGEDFFTLQESYTQNDAQNCIQLIKAIKKKLINQFTNKEVLNMELNFGKEDEHKDLKDSCREMMHLKLIHESENLKNDRINNLNQPESFPDIPSVEEEAIIEEVEDFIEEVLPKEEIEIIPVEEIIFEEFEKNLPYMDSLVLKLHNASFNSEEIKKTLSISDETLIQIYIQNLGLLSGIEEVLDYILMNHPDQLKSILESSSLSSFMKELTKKEQELIYLKLLSKTDSNLTDDVISLLTDIPVEEVINYQIMTKDDLLNGLNDYMNKPIVKPEYEKLKSKLMK